MFYKQYLYSRTKSSPVAWTFGTESENKEGANNCNGGDDEAASASEAMVHGY